jgi:hypothetical protein
MTINGALPETPPTPIPGPGVTNARPASPVPNPEDVSVGSDYQVEYRYSH